MTIVHRYNYGFRFTSQVNLVSYFEFMPVNNLNCGLEFLRQTVSIMTSGGLLLHFFCHKIFLNKQHEQRRNRKKNG
jgi:hypothetical protein